MLCIPFENGNAFKSVMYQPDQYHSNAFNGCLWCIFFQSSSELSEFIFNSLWVTSWHVLKCSLSFSSPVFFINLLLVYWLMAHTVSVHPASAQLGPEAARPRAPAQTQILLFLMDLIDFSHKPSLSETPDFMSTLQKHKKNNTYTPFLLRHPFLRRTISHKQTISKLL